MPPAARISDMHVCPKVEPGPVPHVGGPVATGCATVLVGYLPAARVGDTAICVGPPDTISQGSSNVIIGNAAAARLGDPTDHGGKIVVGCPTVIIGDSSQSFTLSAAAASATPFCAECEKAKEDAGKLAAAEKAGGSPGPSAAAPTVSPTVPASTPWSPTPAEVALAAAPGDTLPQRDAREKVLRDFYERYANDGLGQSRANADLGVGGNPPRPNGKPVGYGIDLGQPLEVVHFPPPETMEQFVRHAGHPGNFFDPHGGQTGDALGLNDDPKHRRKVVFRMPPGEGLSSGNGPILDDWTDKAHPVMTKGGGRQLTVPDSVRKAALCGCHRKNPCPH